MPGHAGSSQSSGGAPPRAALNSGAPQTAALNSGARQRAALNSAAPQRAALSGPLQTLVEDVKQFGRIPKRKKGTSEEERAENKLAKRFSDHRDSIPKDVLQELRALDGALSSESRAVQEVVNAIRELGRIPKQNKGTSEEERAENKLAKRFSDHRNSIPEDVMQELQALGGDSQSC